MGLLWTLLGLGLLGGGLVVGAGAGWLGAAEDGLCGPLASDLTLTLDLSPYAVTCDVTVEAVATLAIEPGVEVQFGPGTGLTVQGRMLALGTESQPVLLTSGGSSPEPGDWTGILLKGAAESRLEGCVVEYATDGVRILAAEGATVGPTIANCTVRRQAMHGIVVEAVPAGCAASLAEPTIAGCTIEANGGCGIYGYGHGHPSTTCVPPVAGIVGGGFAENAIRHNEDGGICLRTKAEWYSAGEVRSAIERNQILANGGDGVRLYGDHQDPIHPRVENNLIEGNEGSGLVWEAVHGDWDLAVVNNTIVSNGGAGIWSGAPAGRMLVTNNVVAGNGGYGLFCASDEEPVRYTNDVWDNETGAYEGCIPGMSDFSADPLFVDAVAGDWALRFGSPCIDAGTASGAPAVDIEGTLRPQGDGFDVGAYEFSAPEIEIWSEGVTVPAGSMFDIGMVLVGEALETDFAIGNGGGRWLEVETVELDPVGDFALALLEPLPLTVTPGSSTTFGVWFAPAGPGRQTATVAIESDDPDDSPYRFGVSGLGVQALAGLTVSGPMTGLVGSEYLFTATVSPTAATQPITYTWLAQGHLTRVNSGGLADAASYGWGNSGVQGITVTAETVGGALTATHQITLYRPVQADFSGAPTSGLVPLVVVFTNTSTGDYEGSWWDFGDQITSILHSPVHTFVTLGAHTVTLRVSGPGGADIESRPAYVEVKGFALHLPVVVRGSDGD